MEAKERNDLTSRKRKQASADALDEDWWLQSNPNDDDAANGQDNLPQTNAKVRRSYARCSIHHHISHLSLNTIRYSYRSKS